MVIISQNETCAVNLDNIVSIQVQGRYIQAFPVGGGTPIAIGFYEDDETAYCAFTNLMNKIATHNTCFGLSGRGKNAGN